ncbi:MAG: hypothetical protein LBE12_12640 [Planctomycetaceae bacterium]|jgi:hypothetical protein|nr:hypothetical protein [Planctomycetaceae bacterium]
MMAGMVGTIGNIGSMVISNAQAAFRVYQVVQKVQTIIELFQLISSMTAGFPAIQQEVMREITALRDMGAQATRFNKITSQDILDILNQLAVDMPTTIATLIASKHSKRIIDALSSRYLPKSKRDVIVIYMPSLEGTYTGEFNLVRCPGLTFVDMNVELSLAKGGGRVVGIGVAQNKKLRHNKHESYQFIRIDWHDTKIKHQSSYVKYFETSSGFEFHWEIPETIKEAVTK